MDRRFFLTTSAQAFAGSVWAFQTRWPSVPFRSTDRATTRYTPTDSGTIRGHNGRYFGNRPLYGDNRPSLVLVGDKPVLRFLDKSFPGGTLMLAILRNGKGTWLHNFTDITSDYQAGGMRWTLRDASLAELTIWLDAVPLADTDGFGVQLTCRGVRTSDQLISCYGGLLSFSDPNLFWRADPGLHPAVAAVHANENHQGGEHVPGLNELTGPFSSDTCLGNTIRLHENGFSVTSTSPNQLLVWGWSSSQATWRVADATAWSSPTSLVQSVPSNRPIVCGISPLPNADETWYWVIESGGITHERPVRTNEVLANIVRNALNRIARRRKAITLQTPDSFLDASLPATVAAMDACWYPPVFVHGGMSWNIPFPGWRTLYGPTCLGWQERVFKEAVHYLDSQRTQPGNVTARSDSERRLSLQARETRFYGQGRIERDQLFYNMQEVFFDQLIHAWRWTGNIMLEKRLLPALELHLNWMRNCFDPDNDGVYESYLNVWASDSLWYNGGGTAQSTAYAYRGHQAAAELCQRAGQMEQATQHTRRAEQIRQGLISNLWISERGYLAEYREANNHRRRHEDACLYTIFLPIDVGLMTSLEQVQLLDYTEWGLERVPQSSGGEQCFTSNFVPLIWSVRELDTADTLHLALAYYQSGLGRQAWKLLEGSFKESMFNAVVPGGISCEPMGMKYTSTDFGESVSMLARVIIEGLFGIAPDRPNKRITFRPQFPSYWTHARLETPDGSLVFARTKNKDTYQFSLEQRAKLVVYLPVYTQNQPVVSSSASAFTWSVQPGYGQAMLVGTLDNATTLTVAISRSAIFQPKEYSFQTVHVGHLLTLHSEVGSITAIDDPQQVIVQAHLQGGRLSGNAGNVAPGRHLIRSLIKSGELSWWQLHKITVHKPTVSQLPTLPTSLAWRTIDIRSAFNGDLRTVYQQQYLTPRPRTTSAQLGVDGYSPWTYSFWNINPPKLTFSNLVKLTGADGTIRSREGIPFQLSRGEQNSCFTTLWDNWPHRLRVPIGQRGAEIAFLVAGTTNPMQTKIANGTLTIHYADDSQVVIDLVHPINYWSVDGVYDYTIDGFALPKPSPPTIQLGDHCRAIVVTSRLTLATEVTAVTLETLSAEVVIGLLAVSIR